MPLYLALLLVTTKPETPLRIRTYRLLIRATWRDFVWSTYREKRFSNTFRLKRNVFMVILEKIQHDLQKSQYLQPADCEFAFTGLLEVIYIHCQKCQVLE